MTHGRARALVLLGVVSHLLSVGCRRPGPCPDGHEATPVGESGVWCHDRKAKTALYLELHPGTRQARQRCAFSDGTLSGPYAATHPGGQRWIEGRYEASVPAGKWTQWDATGSKVAEAEYREGRLIAGAPVAVAATCDKFPRLQ